MVAGCSNVIDEKDIPVVTIPDTGSGADTTVAGGALDPTQPITLGTVTLDPCTDITGAWCGSIDVPLERAHPDGDQIKIGFELHPRTDATAKLRRHDRRDRGRARLLVDRLARLLPQPLRADHGSPRSAPRRRPGHRPVVAPGLQSPPGRRRLARRGRRVRRPAGLVCGRLRRCRGRRRRERRARGARCRPRRPLRRLVRHVRRAGVRGAPRRQADERSCSTARSRCQEAIPFHADRIPAMFTAFDLVCERTAPCKAKGSSDLRTHQGAARVAAGGAGAGVDDRPRRAERRGVGRPREPPLALAVRRDRLDRLPRARCSRDVVARG